MSRDRDPRTGPFERAIRSVDLGEARSVLKHRHVYWSGVFDSNTGEQPKESEGPGLFAVAAMVAIDGSLYLGLLFGVIGIVVVASALHVFAAIVATILVLGMFVAFGSYRVRQARRFIQSGMNRRLFELCIRGECPKCGYDLSKSRDEMELDSGVPLGPRRCPECGAFWPLVPDPTPAELSRWHRGWFRAHRDR